MAACSVSVKRRGRDCLHVLVVDVDLEDSAAMSAFGGRIGGRRARRKSCRTLQKLDFAFDLIRIRLYFNRIYLVYYLLPQLLI